MVVDLCGMHHYDESFRIHMNYFDVRELLWSNSYSYRNICKSAIYRLCIGMTGGVRW